jgi:2-phosphoglycerate kinase
MARTLVVTEGARVPFLRGFLTRSLQQTGLTFAEAYKISGAVRAELRETAELTSDELREVILRHLGGFNPAAKERYLGLRRTASTVMLRCPDGHVVPFSRGRHATGLQACGLSPEQAAGVAEGLYQDLVARGVAETSTPELQRSTYEALGRDLGEEFAHRYLVWQEFTHSGRPLVVLIGGTDGTGKSTISTQLGPILDIMRTQSTDLLREVMRVMIPQGLLPFLHTSSFQAGQVLPGTSDHPDTFLADGYLTQAELVSVASTATIERAVEEGLSVIVEGVHVHPLMLGKLPKDLDAHIVPVMLALLKPTDLQQRLRWRSREAPRRGERRHLENFESIWRLQTFLLGEADRAGIPIVVNEDRDRTVQQIAELVISDLAKVYSGKPDEVFA